MPTWRIEYDTSLWLPVPFGFPDGPDRTVEEWAARTAAHYRRLGWAEDARSGPLENLFLTMARIAAAQAGKGNMYFLFPDGTTVPDRESMPVLVDIHRARAESPDYLLDDLGAHDPTAYDRPRVDHVSTPNLGDGIRVLRTNIAEDGGLYTTLAYAYRHDGYDVIVWTQADDPAALDRATPYVEGLIARIRSVDTDA